MSRVRDADLRTRRQSYVTGYKSKCNVTCSINITMIPTVDIVKSYFKQRVT